LASLADSNVTVPLGVVDDLRDQIRAHENTIRELRAQAVDAKFGETPAAVRAPFTAFRALFPVVQFAVGNLHPSAVRGWPHEALAHAAEHIRTMPDVTTDELALAHELEEFGKLARGYEAMRKQRDAETVVLPAGPADWGPQTEEAKTVHAAHRDGSKGKDDDKDDD
jgi:hypothetical protein